MTATTFDRDVTHGGYVLTRGHFPMRANTLIRKGWIVCVDSDGNITYGGGTGALNAIGVLVETVDNRTTSPLGGAAGAETGVVEYGLNELKYTGTAPTPGATVFVVDNQTVSLDSSSGTRGIAGQVIEVDTTLGTCFVRMGPDIAGQLVIAAAVVADLDTAEGEIDDIQATLTQVKRIPISLTAWSLGGAVMTNFADGATNGLTWLDSEALAIRINPSGDVALPSLVASIPLPTDIDLTEGITLHVSACRIGSADTTLVLQANAFFQAIGAAYDADADAISADSAALDSATKVAKELVLTVAAADLPANVDASVTFAMAPSSALDGDDLCILSTWVEYTPAIASA